MNDSKRLDPSAIKLLRYPPTKTVTVEIDFYGEELTPGVELSRLQIVIAEEGVILGGRLELSSSGPSLSVSPESLEAPSDEDWQG